MAHLYTTRVTAVGGRSGTVRSEDGILDLSLAMPWELGGKGGATNPEQLFAAGCAACFENAVIHVTRARADKVADDAIEVVGEVGLIANGQQGFNLAVSRRHHRRPGPGGGRSDSRGGPRGMPVFQRGEGQRRRADYRKNPVKPLGAASSCHSP